MSLFALLCCAACFPDQPLQAPSEAASSKRMGLEATCCDNEGGSVNRGANAQPGAGASGGGGSGGDGEATAGVGVFFGKSGGHAPPSARVKYWVLAIGMALPLGVSQATVTRRLHDGYTAAAGSLAGDG